MVMKAASVTFAGISFIARDTLYLQQGEQSFHSDEARWWLDGMDVIYNIIMEIQISINMVPLTADLEIKME